MSDAGIAPKCHRQTIGVMRSYPIRVAGNSGPVGSKDFSDEISWKKIAKRSGSPYELSERTSVTGNIRRVFEQDYGLLHEAIANNRPDQIALTGLDYINYADKGKSEFELLSQKSKRYVYGLEEELGFPITLISTGPEEKHIIDRREWWQRAEFSLEPCPEDRFVQNIYGFPWDSGYVENFIDRKMALPDGEPFRRRIFVGDC